MLGNDPVWDKPTPVRYAFNLPSVDSVITKQSGRDLAILADHDTASDRKSSEYTAQIPTMSKHEYTHDGGWQPLEKTLQHQHLAVCEGTFHRAIPAWSTAPHGPLQALPKLHQDTPQLGRPVGEYIRSRWHSTFLRQHCDLPSLSSSGGTSSLCRPLSHKGQGEDSMNVASFTDGSLPSPSVLNLAFPESSMETRTVQQHTLSIFMAKTESRVDSGIPTRLVLSPLPQGVSTIRLPSHCMEKLPFRAPPSFEPSAHTLQLYVSVVCSSKLQDQGQLKEAFAKAQLLQEAEALDGGEVKICPTCINREEKRYERKNLTEFGNHYFQANKDKRLVLFSKRETKPWREFHEKVSTSYVDSPVSSLHVELSMRIACCCRHHDEKKGFGVIFTVKDHDDNVIAQAITKPIMIVNRRRSHNISSL
ncbi:hypothetical protein IFM51744_09071 [Aspergillus udagawae]|nr:hypothetical protein IFM51744_09071 [Aspergillus udagawae]